MSISLLSLSRHRITPPSFLTYNNNYNLFRHHHLPPSSSSSSSSSRFFKGVRLISVTARRDLHRKNQPSKHLLKAKESVKEIPTLAPVLSPDDRPPLLPNQAIGMVAVAQANFMRVVVESAGEKPPRSFNKAFLEAAKEEEEEEEEEPPMRVVGVELLCVVKAVLKKIKRRVLVGDKVLVGSIDWVARRGMIENVFQRNSQVMNPSVANVDHLLVLFSLDQPKLEAFSVTRFLIEAESTDIPLTLALNKTELVDKETERAWRDRLRGWGYEPLFCSVESKRGFDSLECLLKDQTTVIVGPSGVGKSSLINALRSKQHVSDTEQGINSFEQIEGSKWLEDQRVSEVSTRSGRGKHTTRHVSLLPISGGGYLADTPGFSGFSQLSLMKATTKSLALMFPEIRKMLSGPAKCAFNDCLHLGEQGCVVTGDWERYPYYLLLLDEIKIREEVHLRTIGTKREGAVRYKIGDNGVKQAEPRLVLKKHRRQSRKSMNQSLLDEIEEEQDDGDDDDDDEYNLGDVEEVPLEDNERVMELKEQ